MRSRSGSNCKYEGLLLRKLIEKGYKNFKNMYTIVLEEPKDVKLISRNRKILMLRKSKNYVWFFNIFYSFLNNTASSTQIIGYIECVWINLKNLRRQFLQHRSINQETSRGHWQRSSWGTSFRTCSMCIAQPAHVFFPHLLHVVK